jgi:hypothetical protein
MGTVYFEYLEVNTEYKGPQCVVDENEMLEYNCRNAPWPFHVDATAALIGT